MKKPFYSNLKTDRIEIRQNKNPIKMDLFLSFLNVETVRSKNHLGIYTGWTLHENEYLSLEIKGGLVDNFEFLDSIQYGSKLENSYNNYVTPFSLFDIMNDEGKLFFIEYYEEDIQKIISNKKEKIRVAKITLEEEKNNLENLLADIEAIKP